MTFDAIIAAAPKLTDKQLHTLSVLIDKLLDKSPSPDTEVLYTALTKLLNTKVSYRNFAQTATYKTWKKNAPLITSFIDETWPDSKKVTKMALSSLLLGMLRDELAARELPITMGTMVNNLSTVPEVFETNFPNYKRSGLAHLIVKNLVRGIVKE